MCSIRNPKHKFLKIANKKRGAECSAPLFFYSFFVDISLPDEQRCPAKGFAHCDAALALPISVDHGGKLFERIDINIPRRSSASSEFLPTPRKPEGAGSFPHRGLGSFVTFLAHQEK